MRHSSLFAYGLLATFCNEDGALPCGEEKMGMALRGQGVSPGTAVGIVRKVKYKGIYTCPRITVPTVLVSDTIRVELVMLAMQSPNVTGVVTEKGGICSHGATVARELGLPCVVAVQDVTSLLENGQRITIDGLKGLVEVLTNVDQDRRR